MERSRGEGRAIDALPEIHLKRGAARMKAGKRAEGREEGEAWIPKN